MMLLSSFINDPITDKNIDSIDSLKDLINTVSRKICIHNDGENKRSRASIKSIENKIEILIRESSDEINLKLMYEGWESWM